MLGKERPAAADKLHNARCVLADFRAIGEDVWKRSNAPKEDLLWYHPITAHP